MGRTKSIKENDPVWEIILQKEKGVMKNSLEHIQGWEYLCFNHNGKIF